MEQLLHLVLARIRTSPPQCLSLLWLKIFGISLAGPLVFAEKTTLAASEFRGVSDLNASCSAGYLNRVYSRLVPLAAQHFRSTSPSETALFGTYRFATPHLKRGMTSFAVAYQYHAEWYTGGSEVEFPEASPERLRLLPSLSRLNAEQLEREHNAWAWMNQPWTSQLHADLVLMGSKALVGSHRIIKVLKPSSLQLPRSYSLTEATLVQPSIRWKSPLVTAVWYADLYKILRSLEPAWSEQTYAWQPSPPQISSGLVITTKANSLSLTSATYSLGFWQSFHRYNDPLQDHHSWGLQAGWQQPLWQNSNVTVSATHYQDVYLNPSPFSLPTPNSKPTWQRRHDQGWALQLQGHYQSSIRHSWFCMIEVQRRQSRFFPEQQLGMSQGLLQWSYALSQPRDKGQENSITRYLPQFVKRYHNHRLQ